MADDKPPAATASTSAAAKTTTKTTKSLPLNLFDYTEEELLNNEDCELTYYDILGVTEFCTADEIKKAYRKTSLKYHPDKTGRESDDYVFLAVKQAYDTLFDGAKRQAYDSTALPFDDAIPPSREKLLDEDNDVLYTDEDFYDLFGPVFRRNLRYDARLRPENAANGNKSSTSSSNGGSGNSSAKKKGKNGNNNNKPLPPPSLGDDSTDIDAVHKFYEYWIHFESWRDFSQTAADELKVDVDVAESRFERRYLEKEIAKRAKVLKRNEMQRLQTLVERAMECDPRLRRHRQNIVEQKERAVAEKIAAAAKAADEAKAEQERAAILEAQKKELANAQKALMRVERRRLRDSVSFETVVVDSSSSSSSTSPVYADAYSMKEHVDQLCMSLELEQLKAFNDDMDQVPDNAGRLQKLHEQAISMLAAKTKTNGTAATNNGGSQDQQQQAVPSKVQKAPWNKDELNALAKAARKFPAGSGASRWDQITATVNNLCGNDRSKQECIDRYNAIARGGPVNNKDNNKDSTNTNGSTNNNAADVAATAAAAAATFVDPNEWSAEQDKKLQEALALYPASMDKNDRWNSVAAHVGTGKTKKDCVQRFKAIREALMLKKG